MNKFNSILALFLIVFLFQNCQKDINVITDVNDMTIENVIIPDNFDFSTSTDLHVSLSVPERLSNAVFSLIAFKSNSDSMLFAKATFDENGHFENDYTIPAYIDTIMVQSEYLGLIDQIYLPVFDGTATFDYRPLYETPAISAFVENEMFLKSVSADGYTFMGSFNSSGVPKYLTTRDNIQQNLLDDINASLPERSKVPEVNPEFLADNAEKNIVLTKRADVWVTFVAEGAGYRNSLGYYSYKVGEEPKTQQEIKNLNIIFPNVSFSGSGGGLTSGDKVHLGQFEANTVISWFLVADGYNGSTVTNGRNIFFSQPDLNPESSASLKNHVVMLWDKTREQLFLGFEDIPRNSSSCDQDFNDAIFYASANPIEAIQINNVKSLQVANDSDNDGINDELDDFPYDPNKSFNNFAPSASNNGTLAYEDLWPSKGDYDFNDLVLDYKYNLIANAQNKISTIQADFTIKNIGGSYQNGFAFILPFAASKVGSVENQVMNAGFVSLNSNGTESGVNETVIFVIENAIKHKGKTISISVNLATPVTASELGNVPLNPFIVVNGDRSREVHLPDLKPTSKGTKYLGQKDDYSDANMGRYFKSDRNLPWAINFYTSFNSPPEKISIDKVYPNFIPWANSGGTVNLDWYK